MLEFKDSVPVDVYEKYKDVVSYAMNVSFFKAKLLLGEDFRDENPVDTFFYNTDFTVKPFRMYITAGGRPAMVNEEYTYGTFRFRGVILGQPSHSGGRWCTWDESGLSSTVKVSDDLLMEVSSALGQLFQSREFVVPGAKPEIH